MSQDTNAERSHMRHRLQCPRNNNILSFLTQIVSFLFARLTIRAE